MKRYTIEVVIDEGSDEFWEEFEGKTGCDEVLEAVSGCLQPFDAKVSLVRFEEVR